MNQFTTFDAKHYAKSARTKGQHQQHLLNSILDQSLDKETNQFDITHANRKNKSLLGRSKNSGSWGQGSQLQGMDKTGGKIFQASFNHHDPDLCVCGQCNCGRHMCKFRNVKPDLSKGTVYSMSYDRKAPIQNKIKIADQYGKLNGPHLDLDTNNKKDYDGKKGDAIGRPKPEDLLKSGGPCQNLTSYSSGFPGFKGANQYVKPTDNAIRADFPMMSRSTYANSFNRKSAPKPITEKIPDNLRSRDLWMGKTTYGNFFQQPNPENYPKINKNIQKLEHNPDYGRQYETTYKNSFLGPAPTVCQAKLTLQTKAKGLFNQNRQKFAQNTDFKSLNPSFHAISTSKHFYV